MMSAAGWVVVGGETQWSNSFIVKRRVPSSDHIQEALLDLAYNLGPAGLMKRESLIAAARKGDWEAAATLGHRRQVSDERNKEIAALFLRQETHA